MEKIYNNGVLIIYPNQDWIFEPVSLKLRGKKKISKKTEKNIIKTEIYKNDDCVHTVVFVKKQNK